MSPLLKKKPTFQKTELTKYCMISGIMAFSIMVFTYICHSNSLFFGDQTVLRMDLYHQYGPLYAELYDRIVNGYSLVYSWTSGLGGGFLGNLFNYCASPFALFILLLGHKNMPEAIALMILAKAVVSSVTFTYYLNKSNKRNDIISTAFGVLYAFCSYFVAYSWNIMWLDAMSVFPLVILGIEKIIDKRKPALFIISLTYTMITNYYMAYMVCILSVIYFLFYYFSNYSFSARTGATEKVTGDPVHGPENTKPSVASNASDSADPQAVVSPSVPRIIVQPEDAAAFDMEAEHIDPSILKKENREAFTIEKTDAPVPASEPVKERKPRTQKKGFSLFALRFWKSGWTFAGAALLSFALSAFALLPVYFCLRSSSATSSNFPDSFKQYFNLFDFLANHLPAVTTTIRSSGDIVLPNVYSGLITLMLLPFYFLSGKIPGRKKIAAGCILGFFYASLSVNYLNYIWHGFHFPNDLPYRYSFAYSFFLLILAYQALQHIEEFTRKQYILVGMAVCGFVAILSKTGSLNADNYTLVLSILFAVIYVIIAGVYSSPQYLKKSVKHLLIFVIIVEICFANTGNYVMSQSKKSFTSDYDQYRTISAQTEADDTEPFYRTELTKLRARMDPSWYGYNGVSTFSSMAYEHTSHLMEKLGLFGNDINSYTYYPQTPIFNSFFALRYLYDNNNMISENAFYEAGDSLGPFQAYRYKYYLPIAFSVSDAIRNWNIAYTDPFEVQNDLTAVTTGVGDCLKKVNVTDFFTDNVNTLSLDHINGNTTFTATKTNGSKEANVTLYIDVKDAGEYYVYAGSTHLSSIKFTADDYEYSYVSSAIQPFILDVGNLKEGSRITVEMKIDAAYEYANVTFAAARLDQKQFEKSYNTIRDNGTLQITDFHETHFTGTINVKNDNGFIFTSIPYDESWHVTVDGKELAYYDEKVDKNDKGMLVKVGDGLIGFDIEKGEHEIEFSYRARGSSKGMLLTFIGIVISLILILFSVFRKRKNRDGTATASDSLRSETKDVKHEASGSADEKSETDQSSVPPAENPANSEPEDSEPQSE